MRPIGILCVIAFVALASLLGVVAVGGCGGVTAEQQGAVDGDGLRQALCVSAPEAGVGKAAMRREIDACRNAVKASRDAGAE